MALSSSTVSVFYAHRFRTAHNEQLFDSYARRRKVIPKAGLNLEDDEYPEIMEQITLRGWRRLAAPRTDISKLLVQEFYANAAVSDEEAAAQEELPYKIFVRGKEIDFSPNNIRRVMRFKRETAGALTDYKTRQALNQRLDEVLADLCTRGASWKLSSSQPLVPIQLRRTELQPLARGWQEFIIHSLVPTGNKSKITTSRAILIHTIMQGEDVRAEEIIAENMVTIAQGLGNKGNLAHPSTIYKLCKDAAKTMETIRFPRNQQPQQQEDEEEDEPMPQADGGNFGEDDQQPQQQNQPPQQNHQPQQHGFPEFQPHYESQYHETLQGMESHLSSMQFFQQTFYENMQKSQADYMEEVKQIKEKQEQIYQHNQRFHAQVWKEQEKLAKEVQDILRGQMTQVAANNQRFEAERNLQLALERQGRDIAKIRRQVNLWNKNISSKEAYSCWAQQQANPNLSEVPITQIPDIMRTNVEKRRPLFHGFLKSDYGASSSSQVDPEEPVPLRTTPPSPHFCPPYPPSN
ncbi:hypothetical protein PIB30_088054 [Stylosanthes scabra]|uniref:Putative plant transposon protein domain-containing protein n=1 Tax=Stylosanthes scabra TaxID=79078 RepID=A0ABU6QUP5_9FABA|nr:hypothetical protein [Stylosanthes scabra]